MAWNIVFLQILIGVLITVAGILGQVWFFRWIKRQSAPEDMAVFREQFSSLKELIGRRFTEIERRLEMQAEAILESQSRIGDLRESVQWLKAKINGDAWRKGE